MPMDKMKELMKTPPKKSEIRASSLFDTPDAPKASISKPLQRIPDKIDSPHFSNRKLNKDDSKQGVPKIGSKRSSAKVIDKGVAPAGPKVSRRNINQEQVLHSPVKTHNTLPANGTKILLKRTASSQEENPPANSKTSKKNDVLRSPKMTRSRLAERNNANQNNSADIKSKRSKTIPSIPQLDGGGDIKKKSSRTTKKPVKPSTSLDEDDSDSDFAPSSRVKRPTPVQNLRKKSRNMLSTSVSLLERVKPIDRRVLSTDDEDNENSIGKANIAHEKATNFWPEVYCEKEQKWIAVDLLKAKVNAAQNISVRILDYF